MGAFGDLFLLIVVVAVILIVRQHFRARQEQQTRLQPLPPKKVIEVKLPRDVVDANARMRRFYQRVASATANDPQLRDQGLGQLDLIYLIDRPPDHLTPTLRFYIVADERAMATVKRALRTAFEAQAEVFVVEVDPLADVFEQLRQRALKEVEGAGQQPVPQGPGAPGSDAKKEPGAAAAL